jgi:DNA-binding transcriptional ArsR family regulator
MPVQPRETRSAGQQRQLSRLGARFLLRAARIVAMTIDRDLITSLVALGIVRANLAPIFTDPELATLYAAADAIPPDSLRRPVSIYAVAKSTGIPYETVRRHVRKLQRDGLCLAVEGGVILPAATIDGPGYQRALVETWEALTQLVVDAAVTGLHGCAEIRMDVPDTRREALRQTMTFFLDSLEHSARALELETLSVLILRYVANANIVHLITDLELGRQYAGLDSVPPDELRRPVSVYAVGKALLIPYETVRRHAKLLIERGYLDRRADGGMIMPARVLERPEFTQGMSDFADMTQAFMDGLAAIGLPPRIEAAEAADQAAATSPV